jgi:hypothetical protein
LTISSLSISEQVSDHLAPYIGQFNARMWVKSVARRELGLSPEELKPSDLAMLVDGLRPALSTLMGRGAADDLLLHIGREVS